MPVSTQVMVPAVNALSASYVIARYLRLSFDDNPNDESNSIINQRVMIQTYMEGIEEFAGARVVDYVDDGIGGRFTDREAYQRLMRDVQSGVVDCIIVKDLSRIGRNMLDVDDLLMNELVTLQVRFIAINNGYDSFKHPLSNLELAFNNLANEWYGKDLAQKAVSSKRIKMKRGESLGRWAIYGYRKSETEKNKWVEDKEAADTVRLIFSLAIDGKNTTEIARVLNAQDVPTPGRYKEAKGYRVKGCWQVIDPDYTYWNGGSVLRILNDERYTGTAINGMTKIRTPGMRGKTVRRPKEEWIVVPGANPPIVSVADFKAANDALRAKPANVSVDHIFFKKVKCPVCGRTMRRSGKYNPRFYCTTGQFTDHYGCPDIKIHQEIIETVVLKSIRVHAALLVEQEELRLAAVRQHQANAGQIDKRLRDEEKAISLLEASITKHFMALVAGDMTQDVFLKKKGIINETVAEKRAEMERLREQRATITEGEDAILENMNRYRALQSVEKLDRMIVDMLIDHVLIHGEKDIEIVWADGRTGRNLA